MTSKIDDTKPDKYFNADYYNRYYGAENDVVGRDYAEAEVRFVTGFCEYIDVSLKRIVDVGAGTGWWRDTFTTLYPQHRARFDTYETSNDACRLYGHVKRSVYNFPTRPRADLLICRDVLRYIPDHGAEIALSRFADATAVLYLHVVTEEDVASMSRADLILEGSDPEGIFRPAAWYIRRLVACGFRNYGMGLFVHARHDIVGESSIWWGR